MRSRSIIRRRCRPRPAAPASRRCAGTRSAISSCVSRQPSSPATICFGHLLLQREERIVRGHRLAILATFSAALLTAPMQRVVVAEQLVLQRAADALAHPSRPSAGVMPHDPRLHEGAIEREVDLGNARGGRKPALVFGRRCRPCARMSSSVRASQRITHSPRQGRHWPCRRSWLRTSLRKARAAACRSGRCCWRTRRAPSRDAARDEDAEVTDGFVHGVDDGLPIRADLVDVVVEIENPARAPAAAA